MLITHASGEAGVISSLGLSAAGITADTKDPEDSIIGRMAGSSLPNGYLEGEIFSSVASKIAPMDNGTTL